MNTATATTHPVAPEEIMAFLDGELPADHAQAITTHIEHCMECEEIAAQMRATSMELSHWAIEDAPATMDEAVTARVSVKKGDREAKQSGGYVDLHRWKWNPWAIRGGLASAVVLVLLAVGLSIRSVYQPAHQARMMTYITPPEPSAPPMEQGQSSVARRKTTETESSSSRSFNAYDYSGGGATAMSVRAKPSAVDRESRERLDYARPDDKMLADNSSGLTHIPRSSAPAPMIARTVSLMLIVKDIPVARAALDASLRRHQAYAAQLTASTPVGGARSLQASLRVPAPELLSALADLRGLGHVQNETQSGEEVTQQHADLVARLQNSRETEQRLRDILTQRTGKIEDVLQVEEEIARVRGEIEGMEADQKQLEHRVDFATIDVAFLEEYKEQLTAPSSSVFTQMNNAFVSGARHAGDTLLGIMLFLEEYGPVLLIWLAILSLPAYFLLRRYRRIRAKL